MTSAARSDRSILFMPLEFTGWEMGKPQSYTASFGLEDGMLANGARTFVAPAFPPPPHSELAWQDQVSGLAGGMGFDQAWIGLVHAKYDPGFCAWLTANVPVRVGMLFESMAYTPRECSELPLLAGREAHVFRQIASLGLTHVLCGDERDAAVIEASGAVRAIWFPSAVPERFVGHGGRPVLAGRSAFFGNLYSEERRRLADYPGIRELLAFPKGPELATDLPAGFDAVHARMALAARERPEALAEIHARYVQELRQLRQGIFACWMGGLAQWNGLVNLPSYFKGYAGRVIEAMGAGVPAVSWRIPERPRNLRLFEDGREILLFDRRDVPHLVEHLTRLRQDPDFGQRIIAAARLKVLRYHTSEIRVRQVFDWIDEGMSPDYGC